MKTHKTNRIIRVDNLVSNGIKRHVAGDAYFDNGKQYRFFGYDGSVDFLAEKGGPDGNKYIREWRKSVPQLMAMQIAEAIRPHIDRVVGEAVKRKEEQDRHATQEREAEIREQALRDAAPELLRACKLLMGVAEWAERNRKRSILDCCDWSIVRAAISKAESV